MKKTIVFLAITFMIFAFKNISQAFEFIDIDVHGFISQGYLKTDKNNYLAETEDGTFQFNEMGINFSTDLTDMLHIGMQFFARDLGTISNDNVVLDWAFADYRWHNWLGTRIGKIKIDFGLYNETREMDMLRTSVMLPQSVYPEPWRNSFSTIKGLALYGYVPLSFVGKFAYDIQVGAMEFKQDTGFINSFGPKVHSFLYISDVDADYAWFCNLRWNTPLPGLKTKITYYDIKGQKAQGTLLPPPSNPNDQINYPVDLEFNKRDGYVLSLEYTWKNLVFVAEYAQDNFPSTMIPMPLRPTWGPWPPPDEEPPPEEWSLPEGMQPPKPLKRSEGWYVSGSYRFTDWFELGLSYSEYYPNADDKNGSIAELFGLKFKAWLKTTTLSTRFDINEYWVVKLETSYNDGFGGINLPYDTFNVDQYWYLFAAKATFSF